MAQCRLVTLDVTNTCMKITRSAGYHYVSLIAIQRRNSRELVIVSLLCGYRGGHKTVMYQTLSLFPQ